MSSAVVAMKIVTAQGQIEEVTEASDPERLRLLRCSYGLLGIVVEVTFRIESIKVLTFDYETLAMRPLPTLDDVRGGAHGFLGFLEPFDGTLIVERRTVDETPSPITAGERLQCAWRSLL